MADYGTQLRSDMLNAWRDATVATAAGVASGLWSSGSYPHVFWGGGGYQGHRNAGRLPFIEIELQDSQFLDEVSDGGTLRLQVLVLIHVGIHTDWQGAEDQARSMALAGIESCRSDRQAFRVGNDQIQPMIEADFGLVMPVQMTIDWSYNTSDYTVS